MICAGVYAGFLGKGPTSPVLRHDSLRKTVPVEHIEVGLCVSRLGSQYCILLFTEVRLCREVEEGNGAAYPFVPREGSPSQSALGKHF